jgi:predicted transcriptional regulator
MGKVQNDAARSLLRRVLEKVYILRQTVNMTNKEIVQNLLQRMPDDASLHDIAYELEFIAAIQQGVAELDNGQSVSFEEIERDLSSWLTESDSHIPPDRT